MNLINYLKETSGITTQVLTSTNELSKKSEFKAESVQIRRFGAFFKKQRSIVRYINFLRYNLKSFIELVSFKPSIVICYETLSIFPVFLYKAICPKTKIFLHYHEYTTLSELNSDSKYVRLLNVLEKKVFLKANWISHTNVDRIQMFSKDYAFVPTSRLKLLPNYPPASWYNQFNSSRISIQPVKFVYVGALSMDTMYTREFSAWIKELNGAATWDIYSNNFQDNVIKHLSDLDCSHIRFCGDVSYFELPEVLKNYDVGVILYNGHIPNYVYNAPNKLFEYHSCNLDVWFSQDLKGSYPYIMRDSFPRVLCVDFKSLTSDSLSLFIEPKPESKKSHDLYAEEAFFKLVDSFSD